MSKRRRQPFRAESSIDWHQQLGLVLADFFPPAAFRVEREKDLSIRKQLLDVAIVCLTQLPPTLLLPDGMENLAPHNLFTFKSHHEALDDWTFKEFTGHFVNYRKQVSPADGLLLPESNFRLFALCARFPHNLAALVPLEKVSAGVYNYRRGTDVFRILVAGLLPKTENNAMLHLFSASPELISYGVKHYQSRTQDASTLLYQLFRGYQREGLTMPITLEEFHRKFTKEFLEELPIEERLAGLSPQDLLARLSPQDLLARLSPEERLLGLSPEERLLGLSPEEIQNYLKQLEQRAADAAKTKGPGKGRRKPKP